MHPKQLAIGELRADRRLERAVSLLCDYLEVEHAPVRMRRGGRNNRINAMKFRTEVADVLVDCVSAARAMKGLEPLWPAFDLLAIDDSEIEAEIDASLLGDQADETNHGDESETQDGDSETTEDGDENAAPPPPTDPLPPPQVAGEAPPDAPSQEAAKAKGKK